MRRSNNRRKPADGASASLPRSGLGRSDLREIEGDHALSGIGCIKLPVVNEKAGDYNSRAGIGKRWLPDNGSRSLTVLKLGAPQARRKR
jgi:hypothetical protein